MLEEIDKIIINGNAAYTGEELRKHLMEKGYIIVKCEYMPIKDYSCSECGCEITAALKYVGWKK